jgi:hypothetical protein
MWAFAITWHPSSVNFSHFNLRPIRNKNRLWRSCLLTDRDKISNLYRGPSIDASYQVSVLPILSRSINKHGHHRQFLFLIGRFFLNLHLWNRLEQEWPVAAMFVNGSELNEHLYRGPSKDASIFFKSSPLKPFGQMNRNLVGSIYGRSSKDC